MPSRDPLYYLWWTMRRRCERPSLREAARYQGRGIAVCDRWKSFENFKTDMSPRPPGTTLDRIDNSGPYSPENCRWATPLEQANNTRQNRAISMFGKTLNLNQWARQLDINQTVIRKVLKRHPDAEEAVLNFFGIFRLSLSGTGAGNPPAEAACGPQTSAAHSKSALGTVSSTQGAVVGVGQEQPTGCILPDVDVELKGSSGRAKDSSGAL